MAQKLERDIPGQRDAGLPSKLRLLAQNLALLLVSSVLGLLLVEGAARLLYERPWYHALADNQEAAETMNYRMNAFGLRGPDFTTPKPDDVRRIYMAGDSFTFGMGVSDGDAVMPAIVQRQLNASDKNVEVLNGGMLRGSLPRNWLRKWRQVSGPFDPDVVLIVFFLRDGTNTGSIPAFFGTIRTEITDRNAADRAYGLSYLYRLFRDRKDKELVADRYTKAFRDAYFGSEEEQKEWISAQYNVLELKKAAEARGAKVGFVVYPILVDLDDSYPFQDICDLLMEFAEKNGMETLSLLPSFYGQNGPDLWVSPLDQHPNEAGHAIAAEAITPFVEKLLDDAD